MQIKLPSLSRRESGFALLIIMLFVGISLILFASMLLWTSTNSKITNRNNLFNQSEAAAESATEVPLASMIRDYDDESLNAASAYVTMIPNTAGWPLQFQFSDLNSNVGQISIQMSPTATWQSLPYQFSGQTGLVIDCTNTAVATPLNQGVNLSATVQQVIQFADIPLFQFAIFYNMDLEINPGNDMVINGHVHSNDTIWATGDSSTVPLTFNGNVDASTGISYTRDTNYDGTDTRTGNVIITNGVANPNAPSLAMPIGTNNNPATVEGLLNIPPPGMAVPNAYGYTTNGQAYLYNSADLIISNADSSGTNITIYYDNVNNSPQLTPVPPDVTVISTNGSIVSTNAYYSFVTNATFYDYRESDTVQATQLSISNFDSWLTNTSTTGGYQYNAINKNGSTSKGHGINSVYVYNSVPLSTTTLPAVRLVNAQQLPPDGLTVVTPQPLYVEGNYNVTTNGVNFANYLGATTNGNTVPAALMGDAITVLSSAWSDSYNASTPVGSRNPTPTTINAATLEGIVQSTVSANGTKLYSGGVENFLRLAENWSGTTLTYNGSIVVLFPSQYATNAWANASYTVPVREWGYDPTFTKGTQFLPPLTPQVKEIIRTTWAYW
jgi:hypothetical protein